MEIKLADNIRTFRKERALTQEQLAEALGVTVGAVSKWENGACVPEIGMILELSSFFETSVDVLLGYEWRNGGMGQTVELLKSLRRAKRFSEGFAEAEKALKKYPHCFEIVYHSAILFHVGGVERHDKPSLRRAIELFRHALELILQNTDESISEISITNDIAAAYLSLDEPELALAEFKKNNFNGLNNAIIGSTLAAILRRPEEALPYLSEALVDSIVALFRIVTGYMNVYDDIKQPKAALEILDWLYQTLCGLQQPSKRNPFEKIMSAMLAGGAQIAMELDDEKLSMEYLQKAKGLACHFDAAPEYGFSGLKHCCDIKGRAYDDFGSAAEGVERQFSKSPDEINFLELWKNLELDPSDHEQ